MLRRTITALAVFSTSLWAAEDCAALAGLSFQNAAITLAERVATGEVTPPGGSPLDNLPVICRVLVTATPAPDSNIAFEVWMPERGWNHRFLGTGNGGFAGMIAYGVLANHVKEGYAVANTDMGMAVPKGEDASVFSGRPERWKDWGYRATHVMTTISKRIVAAYYGSPASRSYFSGCSTGGEQALMEAQRFPQDYDGIVAGAAANNRTRLHMSILWTFAAAQREAAARLGAGELSLVEGAVLDACAAGGTWIEDPRRCNFDPASLQCKHSRQLGCLTSAQVETVRRMYTGPVNPRTGERIYAGVPRGSEYSWDNLYHVSRTAAVAPFQSIFQWVFGKDWKWQTFDYDRDVATVDMLLANSLNATNPDLSAFRALGHKLISFQGWADALVMPEEAVRYYEAAGGRLQAGGAERSYYRLFMVPGMGHCGGGPGPNRFDILNAIVDWVEKDVPPDRIMATKYVGDDPERGVAAQRPLCSYPEVAQYTGKGSPVTAESYVCRMPAVSR